MRPDLHGLLTFCKRLGYIPFYYQHGQWRFTWKSKQILYFFLICIFGWLSSGYICYIFLTSLIKESVTKAMTWLPWVTGFTMPVITQILFLWRRKEIVIYLQKSSDLWETHKHDSRYHVDRHMLVVKIIYFIFAAMFPVCSICYLNWSSPSTEIYLSSLYCQDNESCPIFVIILSIIQHGTWLFYGFLCYLMMDVLPMGLAVGTTRYLKVLNEHLLEHSRNTCTFRCKTTNLPTITKVAPVKEVSDETPMPESLAPQKIGAIRNIMMEHMQVQRCMIAFNPTFSPFILFSIFNLFAMCVLVFYNAIKVGFEKEEFLLVYFGNGVQILLRTFMKTFLITPIVFLSGVFFARSIKGTMVLHAFGNVRERASETRQILQLQVGLLEQLYRYDYSILDEVNFFCNRLDQVTISAGPYFSCTHSFLISFYGVLATYIAILLQST